MAFFNTDPIKNISKTLLATFNLQRTKAVIHEFNPGTLERTEPENTVINVYDYNENEIDNLLLKNVASCINYAQTPKTTWINVDGIRTEDITNICNGFNIHPLIQEDILNLGQRPKMDEIDNHIFVVMSMLYFNEKNGSVEQEQVSLVLGSNFVITLQEDKNRDVFNPIREKLKLNSSKIRTLGADYLFYSLIDIIVDNYFIVLEKLGHKIEQAEEEIMRKSNKRSLQKVTVLRKEMIVLKRNILPVRDLVNGILRSDNQLISSKTNKYFKDVYDHIMQASDIAENYRDVITGLQDLYMNNVNLKMNEIMKFLAIVTTLMAPATVIGGIFGMNFDRIPYLHSQNGFLIVSTVMIIIPLLMVIYFKKKGWFEKDVHYDEQ